MARLSHPLLKFFLLLLAIIALNELACRLFLPAPQHVITHIKPREINTVGNNSSPPNEKTALTIHEHPDEGGLYKGSPGGRRLNPDRRVTIENHRLSHKRVVIETNSIGYRNPEVAARPADAQYKRILFLGDSIIFQDYLNEPETIVRLVEARAQHDGKHWETINAAVGAISLKTELAILLETGLALQPDVVVLNFYHNDFQESKGIDVIRLPAWLEHSRFLYQLVTVLSRQFHESNRFAQVEQVDLPAWQQHFEQTHQFSDDTFNKSPEAFNSLLKNSFSDFGAAWTPEAWQHMQPLLEELKRLSVEHHFQLVIVYHAAYYQVYTPFVSDYPEQQMQHIASELKIPLLDLLPPLRAEALRMGGTEIYQHHDLVAGLFYDQNHHTEHGSDFVAAQIYQFLKQTNP